MNSKRIATTATLAAAVLAGISVSTNIHADKVSSNGENTRQNAQAPWQARLSQAQQAVDSAQDNLTSANAAVSTAQGNVTSAQGQLTSAQSAVNDQQAVVTSAQTNVNSASAATSSAQQALDSAKSLASSPADIAKTKQSIIDQSKQVQSDQTTLNNAKSAAAESNKKVATAKDQVTTVMGQQSAQQAVVASAKQNRDQASSALSDSKQQVTESQNVLTTAQNNVATAKDGVKTAETALTSAQQAKDAAAANVTNDQNKVQSAQADVNAAKDAQQLAAKKVDAANTKLKQDQVALDTAKKAVTTAEQGVEKAQANVDALKNVLPTFNFTTDQITATKALAEEIKYDVDNDQYYGTYSIQTANAFQNWANALTSSRLQSDLSSGNFNDYFAVVSSTYNNWKDNIQKDRNETVDLENVTAEQANELSIFAADLLNKIANQLGISNIVSKEVATVGASEIASEVAKTCEEDGKTDGHYIYALHQAYYNHGLSNTPANDSEKNGTATENDYGESLSTYTSSVLPSQMSMAEVKELFVQGIAGMLFADGGSAMGHAISMCGLDTIDNANKEQIVGAAPSFVETHDEWNDNAISFHINQPSAYKLNSSNPKQAGLTDPLQKSKPSDDTAELAQAQANLAAKQKDVKNKQAAVDADNTKLTQLNESLTAKKQKTQQAQTRLDAVNKALQSSQVVLTSAQDKITVANTDLTKARTQVQTAEQDVATATQNLAKAQQIQQDKQTALDNAQAELNKEQTKLNGIDQQLSAQQSKLTAAQQDYTAKQKAVADADRALTKSQAQVKSLQNQLQTMQGQAQAVQEAQAALTKATAALTAAQQELQKQQGTLAQLKKTASDNQTKLANAQAALKKAQTKATAAENTLAQAKADFANAQPDSVKYGKQVKIKPVVMTLGDNVPDPTIVNGSVVVNMPVAQSLVLMAAEQDDQLPAGTIAKWANLDQVKHDAAKAGTYAEDVLVVFPDTSTYTVRGVSLTVNPVPVKPTQPTQPSEQPTQPSAQPTQPSGQPTQPSAQPTQPSGQPTQPGEQPTQPSEQPVQSDAEKYGKRIKIKQIVITVGDVITSPNIDINDITVEEAPAAPSIFLMMFAAAPEESAQLPAGTTAKWANFDQVKRDATKAGTYAEDVLITFPDASTYTAQASLLVNPKAAPNTPTTKPGQSTETSHNQGSASTPATKPGQATEPSHNQGSASTPATQPGQATEPSQGSATAPTTKPSQGTESSTAPVQGNQPSANVPVSSEGKATSQNAVALSKNGQLNAAAENNSPAASGQASAMPQQAAEPAARQQAQAIATPSNVVTVQTATARQNREQSTTDQQLPQTGNDTSSVLSLIGFAFTAALAMFGIEKRHN